MAWRWVYSVNWQAWPIAVPLVLAETYSLTDSLLFGLHDVAAPAPRRATATAAWRDG